MSVGARFDLKGRHALVTGASSGLGAHFAGVLAEAGAHVTVAARRTDRLEEVAGRIRAADGACDTVALDVTDPASAEAAVAACPDIDILVNNAGMTSVDAALDTSDADWDRVMDVNLKGVFAMARAAGRAMREHGRGGAIVNTASILGFRQGKGLLPYAVSKAGVVQMTKILALELARYRIRVNAIAPGYFPTEINEGFFDTRAGQSIFGNIPQRRLGELKDLDGPLLLLASDAGAYMTGTVIPVDGGHLVSSL